MNSLSTLAAISEIKGKLVNLPPFKIPYLREKWLLLSVEPPTFPGWTVCPSEVNQNFYGQPITSEIYSDYGYIPEVNLHTFYMSHSSYYNISANGTRLLANYMKLTFTIERVGEIYKFYNSGIPQIYSISYNYDQNDELLETKTTLVDLIPPEVFGDTVILIPSYCSNTCFMENKGQQVQAFWGCYDMAYDGGDFNYKEGVIRREGKDMIFKMPSVDLITYNNRDSSIINNYRIETPIFKVQVWL